MLEEFTEARGKELETELKNIEAEKGKLEKLILEQQADLQKLEALQSLASELETAESNLKKLESRKAEYEQQESRTPTVPDCLRIVCRKTEQDKGVLASEISTKKQSIEKLNTEFAKLQNQAKLAEKELENAKVEYENRDKYRQQCEDLKQIIKIQDLKK